MSSSVTAALAAAQKGLKLAEDAAAAASQVTQAAQAASQEAKTAAAAIHGGKAGLAGLAEYSDGAYRGGAYRGGAILPSEDDKEARAFREYERSVVSKKTHEIVKRIAAALKRAGLSGIEPEEKELETLTAQVVGALKGLRNVKSDAASQTKLCKVVAGVLNDEFSPGASKGESKFIDDTLGSEAICQQIGDWTASFAAGVNTDFLSVHAAVRNGMRNLKVLGEVMEKLYAKVAARAAAADADQSPEAARDFEGFREVYRRAADERRRQEAMLENLLKAQLAPAAAELLMAFRDKAEAHAVIKRIGLTPGTREFSKTAAAAVTSLGTAAAVAAKVHKALKAVGITADEYFKTKDYKEFSRMLDERVASAKGDLGALLRVAETLRLAFTSKDDADFVEQLRASGLEATGGARGYTAAHAHHMHGAAHGGDDEDEMQPKTRVEKAAKVFETEKKLIVKTFARQMAEGYEGLLRAVNAIAPELGKSIPITDRTDTLRDAMTRLADLRRDNERIELALIGLYIDAASRTKKEQFTTALRFVARSAEALLELSQFREAAPVLSGLKRSIEALEKTIDRFSDEVSKKYGRGVEAHGGDDDDDFTGGAEIDLAVVLPEIARSGLSLQEAVTKFAYSYYVAKVRMNLSNTAKEVDSYGERYEDILGDAVAKRLQSLKTERAAELEKIKPGSADDFAKAMFGKDETSASEDQKKAAAAVRQLINDEFDAKEKFYTALQAVDLYMKAFTSGITKDPDSIRDIKQILDGTQTIARWFNETTGDRLAEAFEHLRSSAEPTTAADNAKPDAETDLGTAKSHWKSDGGHYYEKITTGEAGPSAAAKRGQYPVHPTKVKNVKDSIASAVENFQGLKNLVNSFARIGDRFGGREVRTQVFMSPSQIYKVLIDYVKASSIRVLREKPGAANYYRATISEISSTNWEVENRLFALTIKAMAAKILVVLGVYDMFERVEPIVGLQPVRMIVGGDESAPEVMPDAAELYFRLPRLAEFYKSLFKLGPTGDLQVSLVPEIEGIYSGLVSLVFVEAVDTDGEYTETELVQLVREVNRIYEHFRSKSPERPCQAALEGFVLEINRRYGLVKKEDIEKFNKLSKLARRSTTGYSGIKDATDYAILPGEDEDTLMRRPPSDGRTAYGKASDSKSMLDYRMGLDINQATPATKEGDGMRALLRKFREELDKQFSTVDEKAYKRASYGVLIKQASMEMSRGSAAAKFETAARLIRPIGSSRMSLDAGAALMWHETVGVGLATLEMYKNLLVGIDSTMFTALNAVKGLKDDDAKATALNGIATPLRSYIENLFALTSWAEVRISRDAGGPIVSFAKVRDQIETLASETRAYIDQFRGSLESETVKAADTCLEALETELFDRFIRGKEVDDERAATLDGLAKRIQDEYKAIITPVVHSTPANSYKAELGADIAYLVWIGDYAASTAASAPGDSKDGNVDFDPNLGKLMLGARARSGKDGAQVGQPVPTNTGTVQTGDNHSTFTRFKDLYDSTKITDQRSLLNSFNQVLANYLGTIIDSTAGTKVYSGLITAYASGPAGQAVSNPHRNSYPDMAAATTAFGTRFDPKEVLYMSLAYVLQRLTRDVNPSTSVPDHLIATLTDVPLYVKERLRANLPGYARLFDLLVQKGELIKQLVERTPIKLTRTDPGAAAAGGIVNNAGLESDTEVDSDKLKTRISNFIDKITASSYVLANSCGEVLKELADSPVYLQTGEGSIETYKMRYGRLPFMPFSHALYSASVAATDTQLFPRSQPGTAEFKWQYGTRGLVLRTAPPAAEQVPGAMDLVRTFNQTNDKRSAVDEARYLKFVQTVTAALRSAVESRSYKGWISPMAAGADSRFTTALSTAAAADACRPYSLSAGTSLQSMISYVETSNEPADAIQTLVKKLGKTVSDSAGGSGRSKEQIMSLIDMNIVPINVHALMRDIPLAPLYNYEYTFEQLAASLYGEQIKDIETAQTALNASSLKDLNTHKVFLALLNSPYADVDPVVYGKDRRVAAGFVSRIFRGDNDLGMGRPKFLSDQLFNKVLLDTVVAAKKPDRGDSTFFDEAGPSAEARRATGMLDTARVLTWIKNEEQSQTNNADSSKMVGQTARLGSTSAASDRVFEQLQDIGMKRFDTTIVRNLFFISNVVRLVRLKLNRELTQNRGVVLSSHFAVAPDVTEYGTGPARTNEGYGNVRFSDM